LLQPNQPPPAPGPDGQRDGGFTLIELMVVALIVAVLIGIAIPTYLNASHRASDIASRSNLRNALTVARTIYTDNQAYPATTTMVTQLGTEEPNLVFGDDTTPSATGKEISVATSASAAGGAVDTIVLAAYSRSGTCWYYRHVATVALGASGTSYATTGSGTACQAANAPAAAASWTFL